MMKEDNGLTMIHQDLYRVQMVVSNRMGQDRPGTKSI